MYINSSFLRGSARRGLIGLLLVGGHAGAIALFVLGMLAVPPQPRLPPVTVDFLEQPVRVEPAPRPPDPKLVSVAMKVPEVTVVPAEVEVPVVDAPPPAVPVVAPMAAAKTSPGDPPSLSQVAYLEPPAPRYPPESKRAREEGLVILRVLIDESGRASSVNVYRSSGHPRLDDAACNAVQRALFKPYLEGGVARMAVAMVPVEFSLRGAGNRGRSG
jgi:protein TonB